MVKILAVSDLHGYLPEIEACDILLLGGDYCGPANLKHNQAYMRGTFSDWLKKLPAKHKIAITGNHDFALRDKDFAMSLPWTYLQDEMVEFSDVKIYGTPWTPTFYNWAFMHDEPELDAIFRKIPEGLDVLLSHGPPHNIMDRADDGYHCGSKSLLKHVERAKPSAHVFGHIHEGYGTWADDNTHYYNVAYVNARYMPVNDPIWIDGLSPTRTSDITT